MAYVLEGNSTTAPSNTFTGLWEDVSKYHSIRFMHNTDADGTITLEFSMDKITIDRNPSYSVFANATDSHTRTVSARYFRIKWNSSGPVSRLRIQCISGLYQLGPRPLNEQLSQDDDAYNVRAFPVDIAIASGGVDGYEVFQKFGRNPDVDSGTLPEDVWNGGDVYPGFPTGSPEEIQVFSSDAGDTGTLTFTYLASSTATSWQTASVTLQGTTQVNTGITAYRVHTARYSTASATAFNLGEITIRHRTTTANIFAKMPIGRSQTYVSAFTVPTGCTGIITRLFCRLLSNTTASVEGALWVRTNGGSPRLRRPFTVANSDSFEERPYGGLRIEAKSDIIVRIVTVTASNLDIIGGYDIICIEN